MVSGPVMMLESRANSRAPCVFTQMVSSVPECQNWSFSAWDSVGSNGHWLKSILLVCLWDVTSLLVDPHPWAVNVGKVRDSSTCLVPTRPHPYSLSWQPKLSSCCIDRCFAFHQFNSSLPLFFRRMRHPYRSFFFFQWKEWQKSKRLSANTSNTVSIVCMRTLRSRKRTGWFGGFCLLGSVNRDSMQSKDCNKSNLWLAGFIRT